ncbi:IGR protein motif-domain-containing protein [Coniochaeta sp. 2T2.1]|nr:IGR protein motif-domain-containing protein [Coniochaeta sp. 2T2.1]
MKSLRIQSAIGLLLRPSIATPALRVQSRWSSAAASTPSTTKENSTPSSIPSPIPLVPDVETFLSVIGRDLKQHAAKIPSWEALFTLSTDQLRELGVEPPRSRRYLLRWRQRFAEGRYGPGGDFKHVQDGKAELRILEIDKDPLTREKLVVNVPAGQKVEETPREELVRVAQYKVKGAHTICGPYALPLKGQAGAVVATTEGMWEDVRGHKVDGGERRQAEVRFKRRVAERKALREKQGFY